LTTALTPNTSDSRMNSWRIGVQAWPTAVRNCRPWIHSAGVRSTSRAKACRCRTAASMIAGLIIAPGASAVAFSLSGVTEPASDVTKSTATLDGDVNIAGEATTYYFEYGDGNGPAVVESGQSAQYGEPSYSRSPIAPKNTPHPVTWLGCARPWWVSPVSREWPSPCSRHPAPGRAPRPPRLGMQIAVRWRGRCRWQHR